MPLTPSSVAGSATVALDKLIEVGDVVEVVDVSGSRPAAACTALVPFSKAGRGGAKVQVEALKRKVLDGTEGKTPEECREAVEARMKELQVKLSEATSIQAVPTEEVSVARRDHREAVERVEQAIQNELEVARMYRAKTQMKVDAAKAVEQKRARLTELQTKLAMLEIYKANHETMKHLREQREAAVLAAEEAKRTFLEVKHQQRKAIQEASRSASAAGEANSTGRGRKRTHEAATADSAEQPNSATASDVPVVAELAGSA